MKSRLFKPLITTAVVLVVLAGVFFIVKMFAGEGEPEETPSAAEELMVTKEDVMQLRRLTFEMKEKKNFEVSVDATVTPRNYEVFPKFPGFNYNGTRITLLANSFLQLRGIELVEENVSEEGLAQFGLKEPSARATGEFKDGKSLTILVGNLLVTGGGYYAMVEGSGDVYVVNEDDAVTLLNGEPYLRDMALMPVLDNDVSSKGMGMMVNRLTIKKPNGDVLDLRRRSEDEMRLYGLGTSAFELLSPVSYSTSEYMLSTLIFEPFLQIKGTGIVEDNPKDLSIYGLDNPAEVYFEDYNGVVYDYLIGEKDGNAYLMKRGVDSVISFSNTFLVFLNATDLDILFKLLWTYNVDEVTKVEYDLNGQKHTLDVDSDSENSISNYWLNGEEISSDNGKRLYTRAVELFIRDKLTVDYSGVPEYSVSIHLRNGDVHTLKLFKLNDRQYAAEIDGYADYYVHINDINKLVEGFDIVLGGGNIPAS